MLEKNYITNDISLESKEKPSLQEDKTKEFFSLTKMKFNELILEANRLKEEEMIDDVEIKKNEKYIKFLESNMEFIQNEYASEITDSEYSKALNILQNNITNFQNRIDFLKNGDRI